MQALSDGFWVDSSIFDPPADVIAKFSCTASANTVRPRFRDPEHGIRITKRYNGLRISDKATFKHNLQTSGNRDLYQYFTPFASSVMK